MMNTYQNPVNTAVSMDDHLLQHTFSQQQVGRAPFPSKLYQLLEDAESHNHSNIISWLPGGKAFRVHHIKRFCSEVMQKYFQKQTKFNSFTRQLYLYGFMKVSRSSSDSTTFYHPDFEQGNKEQSVSLRRTSGGGTVSYQRRKLLGFPVGIGMDQQCLTATESARNYYSQRVESIDSDIMPLNANIESGDEAFDLRKDPSSLAILEDQLFDAGDDKMGGILEPRSIEEMIRSPIKLEFTELGEDTRKLPV